MSETPQLPHGHLNPDKKAKSKDKTVTSTHDGERIPQVHLSLFNETIAKVDEVDSTNDEVRLVLTSSKRVSIIIPRQQIVSESTLPKPNQFVSILRTDKGYKILTHACAPQGARHLRPTSERGDTDC